MSEEVLLKRAVRRARRKALRLDQVRRRRARAERRAHLVRSGFQPHPIDELDVELGRASERNAAIVCALVVIVLLSAVVIRAARAFFGGEP